MLFYILIAVLNGMVNIVNKIVNLQAKKALGTVNGTLINYIEGTVISLFIALLLGKSRLADLPFWKTVSPADLLGGVFGLAAMVLILNGMAKVRVSYSTVVVLAGQLGAGFVLDSVAAGRVAPLKIAGLCIIMAGVFLDQAAVKRPADDRPAKQS